MPDQNTAIAYFSSRSAAESAVDSLKAAGFQQNQIGVAAAGARRTSASTTNAGATHNDHHDADSTWDKMKNFFGGNSAEPYAGESRGDALDSSVVAPERYGSQDVHRSLSGLSASDDQARYFRQKLGSDQEGVIVTVHASGRADEAYTVLQQNGGDLGRDVDGQNYESADANYTEDRDIELYGEILRVHKDRVSSGEVRLHKEVYTTTQTVEVPVTHEELVIERVAADGSERVGNPSFTQEDIRIPLSEERASVDKEAVLRERIHVGKKEVTNVQSFDEQVRSEDLKVDQPESAAKKSA